MAMTTNRALLFLAGGCAAALAIAYAAGALDPMFDKPATPIVALPEPAETTTKDGRVPAPEAGAPATPDEPAAPTEAAAPEAEKQLVTAPSFDVMRVEGDGSIVIAGRATADANVEVLVGSNVIASAKAGPAGDFAAVLEEPLKPGDYQIVLRSTSPDNVVAMSVETAVVSIPETPDGQVLALVEEPGKPSQMIILPKPEAPSSDAAPEATVEAPAPATGPVAETPAEEPAVEAPAADVPAAEAPAADAPVADAPSEDQMQAALPPLAAPPEAPVSVAPAAPAQTPRVLVEAVEIDGRKIFVAGIADAGRRVRGYANEILLGDATSSPDGRYLIEAERDLPVGDYIIRVDALEADGNKVAARAAVPFEREPGETIAAVAPQAPIAPPVALPAELGNVAPAAPAEVAAADAPETTPAPAAAPTEIAPAPASSDAPPAVEPAQDAVAPAAPTEMGATEAPAPNPAAAPTEVSQAPAAEVPAATTPPATSADAASGKPASGAPAASGATQSEQAAAPADSAPVAPAQTADGSPQAPDVSGTPASPAVPPKLAPATDDGPAAPPAMAEAPGDKPEQLAQAEAPADKPEQLAQGETPAIASEAPAAPAPSSPATAAPVADASGTGGQEDVAMAPSAGETLAAPPPADVPEVMSPKLQNVDSAVIIRRGDTLWRLSYRVYGRGVRYSTIYLANQTQIEEPDRIWPGQVFKLPEKSDDGKAEADLGRLGDRATTIPK